MSASTHWGNYPSLICLKQYSHVADRTVLCIRKKKGYTEKDGQIWLRKLKIPSRKPQSIFNTQKQLKFLRPEGKERIKNKRLCTTLIIWIMFILSVTNAHPFTSSLSLVANALQPVAPENPR